MPESRPQATVVLPRFHKQGEYRFGINPDCVMTLASNLHGLRLMVGRLELLGAAALLCAAVLISPLYNIQWPGGGALAAAVLIAAGLPLLFVAAIPARYIASGMVSRCMHSLTLPRILAIGIVLQVGVAAITKPIPVSDPLTYLELAKQLATGQDYVDSVGHRAFWPPGLPLYLTAFVAIFGAGILAIVLANIGTYLIGCVSVFAIARLLFDRRAGLVAAVLFTIWPSRLLTAGLASKETLTIAMVLCGTTLCVKALDDRLWRSSLFAVGAGLAYGLGALAQPGLLLLVLMMPFAFRSAMQGLGLRRFCIAFGLVFAGMVACLAPWHARNCIVFKGEFCGLTTNGGSAFYRANNPIATGLWIAEGVVPITHLPELEQNKLGFELGKQWIAEDPKGFAKVLARKLLHYLGNDNYGPYWAILRADGGRHDSSVRSASPARQRAFLSADIVSLLFWVAVCGWAAVPVLRGLRGDMIARAERIAPLTYPFMYSAAVFSVFESGSRQHMAPLALVLVLAAVALTQEKDEPDSPAESRHAPDNP